MSPQEVRRIAWLTAEELLNERLVVNVMDTRYGAVGNGTVDDTGAITSAMNDLTGNQTLYFPAGIYKITSALPTIAVNDIEIRGAGQYSTTLRVPSSASIGTFFTFGVADTTTANRVTISDMTLQCQNTPASTAHAFKMVKAVDIDIENVRLSGVAGIAKLGEDASNAAQRIRFSGLSGNFNAACDADVMWIRNCVSWRMNQCHVTGTGTPTAGSMINVDAQANCDGAFLNDVHLWVAGKPYGLTLNWTSAQIVNYFFNDVVLDHTDTSGINFVCTSGSNALRNIRFSGGRIATDNGNCVKYVHSGTGVVAGVTFSRALLSYMDDHAVDMSGTSPRSFKFIGCDVRDDEETNKSAAMTMAVGGWSVLGCNFSQGASAGDTDYAIETTADVDNFTAVGNTSSSLNTDFFDHYSYASESTNRIVLNNGGSASNTTLALSPALNFTSRADPASPSASHAVLFSRLNGSSKMEMCAIFPSGVVQVMATEP